MRGPRMRLTLTIAIGALALLVGPAQAGAALPKAVGVAVVSADEWCSSGGCLWEGSYNGLLGPVTGNRLTVTWSADGGSMNFDSPLTVMLVQPRPIGNQQCTAATFAHAVCALPDDEYNVGCRVNLQGDFGPDVITVRNLTTGPTPCPYVEFSFFDIFTDRGNDVVNARDGIHTNVNCGAGYDRAFVDLGDTVALCEVVTRG
jgi:hypothetical protein